MVRTLSTRYTLAPIAAGLLGALFLSGVYLGLVSLAESPQHALDLFWEDRLFVVPILGLSAAAAFLAQWKVPFLAVGLLTNLIGIAIMLRALRLVRRHAAGRLAPTEASA